MLNKNNLILAGITGVSAAAVAVLSIGGYFLHKKALKNQLQKLAMRQAMNLAFFDLAANSSSHEDYYDDDNEDYDYYDDFFDNLDTEDNDE